MYKMNSDIIPLTFNQCYRLEGIISFKTIINLFYFFHDRIDRIKSIFNNFLEKLKKCLAILDS